VKASADRRSGLLGCWSSRERRAVMSNIARFRLTANEPIASGRLYANRRSAASGAGRSVRGRALVSNSPGEMTLAPRAEVSCGALLLAADYGDYWR
jgi:hypothetical protein